MIGVIGELRLALLGGLQLSCGGTPLTGFVSSKARALLCYLAVTGRPHMRPALAGLLWGERPEADAATNLRKALSNLHQLAAPHLIITREAVAFNPENHHWLDVEVFQSKLQCKQPDKDPESLREAVALYRGDFLEGFHVRDAPAFEEWTLRERERLRNLALQGLHTLAAHHTTRGEYPVGIEYASRLLALDPWREEAHRQLMVLLAHSGQRSAALVQYKICCRILAEELGVEPMAETTALYERIRAADSPRPLASFSDLPPFS